MPADMPGDLFVGADNGIYWVGLHDRVAMKQAGRDSPIAADYINDATITWVIRAAASDGSFDAAGALVTNGDGTMEYIDGSNGNYVGTIEEAAVLTAGEIYWVVVSMSASGDRVDSRKLQYVAQHRGSN
jgi:hypothetical protein